MVAVREHVRGGVKVRAHSRNAPGAGRELSILGALVAAVFVFSANGGGTAGQGSGGEYPRPAVKHPGANGTAPVVRITFPTRKPIQEAP